MASPTPLSSLDGSCSIILNDTLYVYSPTAFQSLPLTNGSEWTSLPNGKSVTGARCIKGTANGPGSDDALWVVGGASQDSSYPGLQRYTFSNQSWTTIKPVTPVTQNRQSHAAIFLNDSASILVYAGSQDDPTLASIQTFVISTMPPYNVLSFTGRNLPVLSPLLLRWNSSTAVAVGGGVNNMAVSLFDTVNGWSDWPTSLLAGLKSRDVEQASLITGSDGSKVLALFDMSVSPNLVTNIVLADAKGVPARVGTVVGKANSTSSSRLAKRDDTLFVNNWPSYNNSAAPTYTRQDFSLAVSQTGLTAITGGNDEHPVALFNMADNSWVDSSRFFGLPEQQPLVTSASSNPTSSTAAPSPTSSSFIAHSNHISNIGTIVGAVLGAVLGLIALIVIILLILRYRRLSKERKDASYVDNEKERLSFADRGDPMMMDHLRDTKSGYPNNAATMMSNKAIIPGHKRGGGVGGSDSSTARLVPDKGPYGGHDAMEMQTIQERNSAMSGHRFGDQLMVPNNGAGGLKPPKRSSGWSRYFSGTEVASAGGQTPRRSTASAQSVARSSRDASSTYSDGTRINRESRGPTQIPPLNLGGDFTHERVSSIVTGSPTTEHFKSEKSLVGDSRPHTARSSTSSNPSTINESLFSHEPQQHSQWTPVTGSEANRSRDARGTSGNYGDGAVTQAPAFLTSAQYTAGAAGNATRPPPSGQMDRSKSAAVSGIVHGKGTSLDSIARPEPVLTNGPRPSTAGSANPSSGPAGAGRFGQPQGFGAPAPATAMGTVAGAALGVGAAAAANNGRPGPRPGPSPLSTIPSEGTGISSNSAVPSSQLQNDFGRSFSSDSLTSERLQSDQLTAFPQPGSGQTPPGGASTSSLSLSNAQPKGPTFLNPFAASSAQQQASRGLNHVQTNRPESPFSQPARPSNNHDSVASDMTTWSTFQNQAGPPSKPNPAFQGPQASRSSPLAKPSMLASQPHDSVGTDMTLWPAAENEPPQSRSALNTTAPLNQAASTGELLSSQRYGQSSSSSAATRDQRPVPGPNAFSSGRAPESNPTRPGLSVMPRDNHNPRSPSPLSKPGLTPFTTALPSRSASPIGSGATTNPQRSKSPNLQPFPPASARDIARQNQAYSQRHVPTLEPPSIRNDGASSFHGSNASQGSLSLDTTGQLDSARNNNPFVRSTTTLSPDDSVSRTVSPTFGTFAEAQQSMVGNNSLHPAAVHSALAREQASKGQSAVGQGKSGAPPSAFERNFAGAARSDVQKPAPLNRAMLGTNHDSLASDVNLWQNGQNSADTPGNSGAAKLAPSAATKLQVKTSANPSTTATAGASQKAALAQPQRASIAAGDDDDLEDDDDDDDYDMHVEVVDATRAPTAVTAIPVPGSTAMEYTVRKPSKTPSDEDAAGIDNMSWFNMSPVTMK